MNTSTDKILDKNNTEDITCDINITDDIFIYILLHSSMVSYTGK